MPDSTSTSILTSLRNELERRGLVRRPGNAGPLPPAFLEPRGGAPAPGDREPPEDANDLIVTLRLSTELAARGAGARYRVAVLDVVYRSDSTAGLMAGRVLDNAIRDALTGPGTYGVGVRLDAGGPAQLDVLEATVFGGLGPVADIDGVRTEVAKYALEVLA